MKKTLSIILTLILSVGLIAGCNSQTGKEENNAKVINPLPETLDVNALDNCTVAVSLEKGNAYVDDSGKMVMDVTVYSYELYDMADIAALFLESGFTKENQEFVLREYFGGEIPENAYKKILCFQVLWDCLWAQWTVIKEANGDDFGTYGIDRYNRAIANLKVICDERF